MTVTNGQSFPNTASYYYEYLNPDKNNEYVKSEEVKSTAAFLYRAFPSGVDGRYSSNKTVENFNTGTYPKENDVLMYTILAKNDSTTALSLQEISDEFSPNLSAYNGTKVINRNSSANAIEAQYFADNAVNAVLWDSSFTSVIAADQSALKGVTVSGQNINFDLAGMALAPNQILKITYTMYPNSDFATGQTVSNTFSLYNTANMVVATGMCSWGLTHRGQEKQKIKQ